MDLFNITFMQYNDILKLIGYIESYDDMTQIFDKSKSECMLQIHDWYGGSSKHYLSKRLDCYIAKSQIIKKYVNILHVGTVHWILLVAEMSSDKKYFVPVVYTVDGMNFPNNNAK